jgi:hypothetical protein
MKRLLIVAALVVATTSPASGQFAVIDYGNLAQAVVIAERTLREYETLRAQYETLLRMSRPLPGMERYRIPAVPMASHDASRWTYGQSWLSALNTGDPDGSAYRRSIRRLEGPEHLLQQLPASARRTVEQAYAMVEIADALAQSGGDQLGLLRSYSQRLQQAIDALEADVVSSDPQAHEMTATLDKVAAGALIGRRQDAATNQLLTHALEQLLVRGKRARDSEAATMNMRLEALRNGRAAGGSVVEGAADDLRRWRQP